MFMGCDLSRTTGLKVRDTPASEVTADMAGRYSKLKEAFKSKFGNEPELFARAPGRTHYLLSHPVTLSKQLNMVAICHVQVVSTSLVSQ